MHIRVVDASGVVVAHGRDLAALRREVGKTARAALEEGADEQFHRDGLTAWEFDELPERVDVHRSGVLLAGFPAIVDQGRAVGLRLLDSSQRAELATRAGLRRLALLAMPGAIESAVDTLPGLERMGLLYAPFGGGEVLRDQLALLVADRAVLGDDELPRSAAAFETRLDRGFGIIWDETMSAGELARAVLEARQSLALALHRDMPSAWEAAVLQIREQIEHLLPSDFLTVTPYRWLKCLPRFLRAEETRFRKLGHGGHVRDAEVAAELAPWWQRYVDRRASHQRQGVIDRELELFRWMLQELRVSRFAQELGTSLPVSTKKLQRQWERTRG
jgi:ATP-dependent helicase HrpA